jgi:hypothetical protein
VPTEEEYSPGGKDWLSHVPETIDFPEEKKVLSAPEPTPSYSPGGKDWSHPTEDDAAEWKQEQYLAALHAWAKPKIAKWYCRTCKRRLNEDFRLLDRNEDKVRFKCKCNCGHEHTVTLY